MGFVTATAAPPTERKLHQQITMFFAITASGFRRYATYRQAAVANAVTNTVFGFLRLFVLLAAAEALAATVGTVAGYSREQLATYVWVGQGLIGVIGFWGWTELSDRVRTGDVVTDLLRPVPPVLSYLAADLGRAGHAMLSRFVLPIVVGSLAFALHRPTRPATYPLFALSVLLAVVISFGCRYVVNASAFWLLDSRGVVLAWTLVSGLLSGLYFPLHFLPGWASTLLWWATPLPSLLQTPLDVAAERTAVPATLGMVGLQLGWAAVMLGVAQLVQRRGERRLVVQGG